MSRKIILFLPILFLLQNSFKLIAQKDTTYSNLVKPNKDYFKSYLLDARDIFIAPAHWNSRQWITATAMSTTAVTLLFTADQSIHDWAQKNKTGLTDNISKYGLEPWGRGIYSMSTMSIFYIYGAVNKNERAKKVALLGLKAYVLTGLLINIPKYVFQRERPFINNDPMVWHGPFSNYKNNSFPSGHSLSAFAMATIIASEYTEYKTISYTAYSIAGLTALSRIYDNKHWGSDVLIGAALGWATAKLIYNHNNWNINVSPYFTPNTTGMLLQKTID